MGEPGPAEREGLGLRLGGQTSSSTLGHGLEEKMIHPAPRWRG